MTSEAVDALFFSYYGDLDRWHNDGDETAAGTQFREGADQTLVGRIRRQSVRLDGKPHDFARFMSWVRQGDTRSWRQYDAYTPTHLSGAFYESLLGGQGFSVRHINYADRTVVEGLAERYEPTFVLFSVTMMIEIPTIMDGLQRVRRAWPGAKVIVGGFILSELERDLGPAEFQRVLQSLAADAFVITPQGEEAVLALLHAGPAALEGGALPNTWVAGKNGVYALSTERAEKGLSMDTSWVRWGSLDPADLYHTVHLRTARSCTFKCTFCSLFNVEGALAMATPETLRRELNELERLPGVRSIVFTDDTFNVPRPRFRELLAVLADFDFEWYCFFRCQFADRETVSLMRTAGCRGVFLGLEAVDDRMLSVMNKAATVDSYRRGLEQLNAHDIFCHGNFIVGFPSDVPENAERIVEFVDQNGVDFFSVSPWFCAPSMTITEAREEYGLEGNYYNWKHNTMDSRQAIELEQQIIHQARVSSYVSQLSADTFWTELLLVANGFSVGEVKRATRAFSALAGDNHLSTELAASPRINDLRQLLMAHPMAAPAGRELRLT